MSESVSRSTVESFFQAYAERDAIKVASLLHDDVEWVMTGPVEVFPFCGVRRGKASVLDQVFRVKRGMLNITGTAIDRIVIDGDSAAAFSRITALHESSGRVLTYHSAHFTIFRDGKLVSFEVVTDTFGIAEQVIGHRIDAFRMPDTTTGGGVIGL